jgi:hypothetical protein
MVAAARLRHALSGFATNSQWPGGNEGNSIYSTSVDDLTLTTHSMSFALPDSSTAFCAGPVSPPFYHDQCNTLILLLLLRERAVFRFD